MSKNTMNLAADSVNTTVTYVCFGQWTS